MGVWKMQEKIFKVEGSDKRKQFAEEELDEAQKAHGSDVEYFSPETGFALLSKDAPIKYHMSFVRRALSAARLSLKTPLELREFYYAMRQNPDLVKPFDTGNPDTIYPNVLRSIMDVEILCDVDRDVFTIGNLSKGFIYYYHSPVFGQKERKIAFTEVIARTIMSPEKEEEWQCGNCENIIVVEKNAAATRMVELGISEFTNSIIVTVGGNFSRAIWELTDRFKDKKNMIFMADADAYGVDMLRTIRVGTESSRHLPYKFPPEIFPKIFLAGLYPSIGEDLNLPNDVEQKRPLQNPFVQQRIAFLRKYGLLNAKDEQTWKNDKTYELEALSTSFTDEAGKPIGLGIYIVEYMRLHNIPVKPPIPPDDELEKEFHDAAIAELRREIDEKVTYPKFFWDLYHLFTEKKEELIGEILEKLLPAYEKCLERVTAKEIKFHIYKQFEADPKRSTYDLAAIAHKLKTKFDVIIDWAMQAFEIAMDEALIEYDKPSANTDEVEFTPIHNETNYDPNGYDLILKRMGAKDEDVARVREALKNRFGME
jgi:hypothetical protein